MKADASAMRLKDESEREVRLGSLREITPFILVSGQGEQRRDYRLIIRRQSHPKRRIRVVYGVREDREAVDVRGIHERID